MRGLTKRDEEVLEFIKAYMKQNGTTPTIREISKGVGLYSPYSGFKHFQKLVNLGYITQICENSGRYTVKGMRYVEDG
jgi:SOS-response transcriptional repressor LexA